MAKKDSLYSGNIERVEDFVFDEQVVEVFDDMIQRSVPLYREVQHATVQLAAAQVRPGSLVYDLGCSTGTTLGLLAAALPKDVRVIGVDNSKAMLERCQARLPGAELLRADLHELAFEPCSVVILNYTLQFIPVEQRSALLARIHAALQPGGLCLLSEKIRHDDAELQEAMTALHHDFKRRHGYSDLEIARKREALENVLTPLSAEQNLQICRDAGFAQPEIYLKWYTFVSLLARKDG